MEITPRIKGILSLLLAQETPIQEQAIADAMGVSKRTIQREFDYMKSGLEEDFHLELNKKKGIGVWIAGDSVKKTLLKEHLREVRSIDAGDKERRQKLLLIELLKQTGPRKLYYYSAMFGVSEATISGDLEYADGWFAQDHIEIIRKPGYGVVLKGSEKNYRAAMQRFINENINDGEIRTILARSVEASDFMVKEEKPKNIYDLFSNEILGKVSQLFDKMNEPRLKEMTEESYIGLLVHITIAIERILKGEIMEENQKLTESFFPDEDYELAKKIMDRLADTFAIDIPEVEMTYILLHIKGAKLHYTGITRKQTNQIQMERLLDIVDGLIDAFDSEAACELKCDEDFIHGLLVHLEPTLVRLQNDMNIYNPILTDIQKEYPDIYEKCKRASQVITDMTGLRVLEEEVGYLAVHFGAAMARVKKRKEFSRTVAIGVICASGFGVARLMLTKVKNLLGKRAELTAYGKDEVTQFIASKTDFFISSMNVDSLGVDYVQVSPLITKKDFGQIEGKVEIYSRLPEKIQDTDFTRQLDEINSATSKIKGLIRSYRQISVDGNVTFEEAINLISQEVTENGAAAALLKADLMSREQIMSQVFPDMEFALFHCRTKAVKEAGFYTCVPDHQRFTNEKLKEIKAAIVMLMPMDENRKQNAEILGYISSSLVENKEFIDTIFQGNEIRVREQLQKILKTYFAEYLNSM